MRGMRIAAVAFCATVLIGHVGQAQVFREISGPSELPPASFKSDQYVDSRGCVFIRAGYGGVDTWVPRVGNNRKPICGKPSSVKPAPVLAAPVVIAPTVVAPTVVAAPQVKPPPRAGAPLQTIATTTTAPRQVAASQTRLAASVPAASYVPARVAQPQAASGKVRVQLVKSPSQCPGAASGAARQLSDGRFVLACGAAGDGTPVYLVVKPQQAAKPVQVAAAQPVAVRPRAVTAVVQAPVVRAPVTQAPVRQAQVTQAQVTQAQAGPAPNLAGCAGLQQVNQLFLVNDGRLVVRCGAKGGQGVTYLVVGRADVAGAPAAAVPPGDMVRPIPKGYKLAWDDGRLSPTRGTRAASGVASMQLVWTDDTPRRLVDRANGQDVTMNFAYLVYPYTTYSAQVQALGGANAVRVAAAQPRPAAVRLADAAAPVVRLSTKSVPVAGAGTRFVQVGTFGEAGNAAVAAARLKAAGLPVRIAEMAKGGKTLRIVLAGPFGQADQLVAALATARRSGFADAFARN